MSDFDKEAEREKLREKFEAEEEKREATEQMSELLLKGATMTNAHCSDCGDPVFRYDGQEFCPTCQKPISRDQQQGETADGEDAEDTTTPADPESGETQADDESGDHIEVANPSEDARVQFGGSEGESASDDATAPPADGETDDPQTADADSVATDSTSERPANDRHAEKPAAGRSARDERAETPQQVPSADPDRTPVEDEGRQLSRNAESDRTDTDARREVPRRDTDRQSAPSTDRPTPSVSTRTPARSEESSGDVAADLAAAEALLAQTARRFAERAAATENPREAQDHLAAAREAAAALDATRR
ncbi:Sjogren's syndrome/scleroderma autoantigen 1 family protein [Haloarcula amylovorans]|uniref:Sjogren's syndrome/scleroderma autoantigen 1 family protein n=1 Tax=Haloarcula amylovorans TaxID=2562280 RepID=UPI0010760922|nr:Sjogren's syndrome/scleroderma autoantigen 1 family protein [Halomicroarcula amylolytica]